MLCLRKYKVLLNKDALFYKLTIVTFRKKKYSLNN